MSEVEDLREAEAEAEAEASAEARAEARAGAGAGAGAAGERESEVVPEKQPGKLQQLLVEYGVIALIVFLSVSVLVYAGFVIAISAGWETEGAGEEAGVWLAAYVALQLTKPIRIPVVVVLTPIVAGVWHRIRGRPPRLGVAPGASSPSESAEAADEGSGPDESR